MKQTLNRIGLVLILTTANISVTQAQQSIIQGDISWFTSNTSSLLNRSSVELAKKRINRGVRFAHQALAEKLNPMDEFIAYHNLCVGYLASDRPVYANQFCARAFVLAQGPYSIVKIRGALRLQGITTGNNTMQKILSPVQVIVSNIQQQNAEAHLTLLMK